MNEQSNQIKDFVQLMVERLPLALIVWDTEFRVQYWNPAAENLFGYPPKEALGKHAKDLILPQNVYPLIDPIWRRLLQGDSSAGGISECKTRSGARIACHWTNTPFQQADGTVFCVLSMLQEVTRSHSIALTADQSECKLRSFFQQSQDGMTLVNRQGKIIEWNSALEQLTGLSQGEAQGRFIWDIMFRFMPDHLKQANTLENIREMNQACLAGQPAPWLNRLAEYQIQRPDGELRTVQSKAFLIELGKEHLLGTIMRDITGNKILSAQLQDSESKYRSLVDNAKLGIFRSTPDGRHLEVNQAMEKITGYSREELLHMNVESLYLYAHERKIILNQLIATPEKATYEIWNKKKNGDQIIVAATMSPVRDSKGVVVYFDGILEDITERKRLEEQNKILYEKEKIGRQLLEEEAKARGMFIEVLGHELRTPLTPVLSSIGLLKDTMDRQKSNVLGRLIDNAAEGAGVLAIRLDELLDLGRIYQGDISLKLQLVDMKRFIEDISTNYTMQNLNKDQKLVLDLADDLPQIEADPTRLSQVLKVLLLNAGRFSLGKGNITLKARSHHQKILVEVQDEGISISPEEQTRLFQPYHKVEIDRHEYPGISLSLAISKQLIERHGGAIWVQSRSGSGNVFSFVLPIRPPDNPGRLF